MQYILTEAEYNELLHYKIEYKKPDSIAQKHIELLVKYNELKSQHMSLKANYDNVLLDGIESIDKKLNLCIPIKTNKQKGSKEMLINSNDIKTTKQQIDVMQAFIDGKEIEFKKRFQDDNYRTATDPIWDFINYAYRIKPLEPEFVYPIYKRLKHTPETVVEFHSINAGIYISVRKDSFYKPGDATNSMAPHTDSAWEDYTVSIDAKKRLLSSDTVELFEVMVYCDIVEEYSIKKSLYSNENLEELQHYQKTGRSFIIDKDTRKIIKVINT